MLRFAIKNTSAKRTLAYATLVACVALAFVCLAVRFRRSRLSAAATNNSSQLIGPDYEYDFGQITPVRAASLEHEFILKNSSHEIIRITRTATSCGCTTAALASDVIGAGETVKVPFKVNWRDRNGLQSARVTLQTDESPGAAVTLILSAQITNPLAIGPRQLEFGEIDPGPSAPQKFSVTFSDYRVPFRIIEMRGSDAAVRISRVEAPDSPLEGPAGEFAVSVVAGRTAGFERHAVFIKTTLSDAVAPIVLSFRSRGAISATPQSILFDPNQPKTTRTQIIQLRIAGGEAVPALQAVIEAVTGDPSLEVVQGIFSSDGSATVVPITVRYRSMSSVLGTARLRVKSGDDRLEIPIVILGHKK